MRVRRSQVLAAARRRVSAPVAGGLALAAAAGAGALAVAEGRVVLHACLPTGLGPWGVGLAVLRDASDCPEGSYALGTVAHGAVVLLTVAVPVLVAHLVAAACGIGLSAAVRAALRSVPGLLRALVGRAVPAGPLVVRRARLHVRARARRAGARLLDDLRVVRGPPVVV